MTDWMILISNIAAGSVRAVLCQLLVFRLLSSIPAGTAAQQISRRLRADTSQNLASETVRGYKKLGMKSIAAAAAGAAVIAAVVFTAGLPDFYRIAAEAVWFAACARRFQDTDARMSLFIGIFYETAVSLWQFLFAAWLGVLFHCPAFLDYGTESGQLADWLLHALLAAAMWYFYKHQHMTGKEAFRTAAAIALAGFLAAVSLSEQTVLVIADDTLDMWTMLAVVLMMSVLAFNMNRQYEIEKELARLKSEQAELLERDYTALNNAYAVNAKLFHDFHNHIGALRQLLSRKKIEEAVQYLDELQAPVREMTDTVWTGDETIDYLMNSKAAAAKASGIRLQAQVEFPRHTNIRSADLCAVLGNLLDNALEAAGQVPETGQRFIQLTIRRINQMLVIKVENSFSVLPVKQGSGLQTTKEDNGLHGWGLKSAQTAAEKYDGMVQTSYEDSCGRGVFRAVATLSYQGVAGG